MGVSGKVRSSKPKAQLAETGIDHSAAPEICPNLETDPPHPEKENKIHQAFVIEGLISEVDGRAEAFKPPPVRSDGPSTTSTCKI